MSDITMVSPEQRNIWTEVEERCKYRIYLTDVLDFPQTHIEAIDLLRAVSENDEVHLYITSPGGLISIADMYEAAISESRAKIITHGVGSVCSAAVDLFLLGDVRIPEPGSYYMIHNAQYGAGGDAANVKRQVDFFDKYYREKYYERASEILTPQELVELFERAGEIYLTAEDMKSRLEKAEEKEQPETYMVQLPNGKQIFIKNDEVVSEVQEERDPSLPINLPDLAQDDSPTAYTSSVDDDTFEVTLDDGYCKTFKLSTLAWEDFTEYNREELVEIAQVFGGVWVSKENSFDDLVDYVINLMTVGANGGA